MVCGIWPATCGSGLRIGTMQSIIRTHRTRIHWDRHRGTIMCCTAVRGLVTLVTFVRLTAARGSSSGGMTMLGFGWWKLYPLAVEALLSEDNPNNKRTRKRGYTLLAAGLPGGPV